MEKKIRAVVLTAIVCLTLACLSAAPAAADNRHILRKYTFHNNGTLAGQLQANFGSGSKNVLAEKTQLTPDKRLLLLAFAINEEEVFAKQLFDSRDYSLYKVKMRDSAREELVVLGLGAFDGKKVLLKEIYIVGEDDTGTVKAMPVKGFVPTNVLNAPLQMNRTNSIVFPTQVGERTLEISWSTAGNEFIVGSAVGTVSSTSSAGSQSSSGASIEEDDSVFEE